MAENVEMPSGDGLLLDVGVPFRMLNGQLHIEVQAHHGIQCWLRNFSSIKLCAPVIPESLVDGGMDWTPAPTDPARFSAVPLPWGYGPRNHLAHASAVRANLRKLIPQHRWLCFANLGWLGAWGRIAAEESFKLKRPYSVWLDWALHEMPLPQEGNGLKRLWRQGERKLLTRLVMRDIRRASLGLFNGRTVFDAYSAISRVPRIVHDIHLTEEDIIPEEHLHARLSRMTGPIRLLYVGRVHEMKGPKHWLDTVASVVARNMGDREITASWIGDGPMLEEMRAEVARRNLAYCVSFLGIERDRGKVLAALRDADLFVFCHLTPESPRVLIEALMSGLPLVGFSSAYATDLVVGHDAGSFVTTGNSEALAERVLHCIDRSRRLRMSVAARSAGMNYSDAKVFAHRSGLIKQFL